MDTNEPASVLLDLNQPRFSDCWLRVISWLPAGTRPCEICHSEELSCSSLSRGQAGDFHIADLAALLRSLSMVVLIWGSTYQHLSAPGARPGDSAMPEENYASAEIISLVH